ncbi:MAG TPA: hypothetical protein VIB48_15205 [Acidimicrobiia bacterium]
MNALNLASGAWDAWMRGERADAERLAAAATSALPSTTRRERQLVEVVRLAIGGHTALAHDLASEHLSEFPHDALAREVRDACAPR